MRDDELGHRLSRLAERTAPVPRPALAAEVVARHRARRRQSVGLTALVAAVAAVVLAVPLVLGGPTRTGQIGSPPPAVDVLAGPTRGSLAGDTAFVDGVRRLPWSTPGNGWTDEPDAPLGTRRVVYAGDVGGGRWALVAGENTARPQPPLDDPERQTDLGALSGTAIAWFIGPPGATPEQMVLQSVPRGVDPTRPVSMADGPTGAALVVSAPGDRIEVSLRPEVAADAEVTRQWQSVGTRDGTAVVPLPVGVLSAGLAVRYRVSRDGVEVVRTMPDGSGAGADTMPLDVARLRPGPPASAADDMTAFEAERMVAELGRTPEEVELAVLWAGDVPAPAEQPGRVTVLTATVPSGAVSVRALFALPVGDTVGGTSCGSALLPAGPPLPDRTVVARCDATDMSGGADVVSSLVVVAPPTASSVRLLDDRGAEIGRHRLVDGVGVVPCPDDLAGVETLAADGTPLLRTAPIGTADWGD